MRLDLTFLSLWGVIAAFLVCAAVIAVAGTKITGYADRLADRTGLGEALVGAVLLGGCTSLSGIVTSVTAAAMGHPVLAVSNAIGGIAAQTAFLGVADMTYRKANLEHAAASPANLTQGALLVTLLGIPLVAMASPDVTVWGVHPATLALVAAYGFGLHLLHAAKLEPMWAPRRTRETAPEEGPQEDDPASSRSLWAWFAGLAAVLAASGYGISQTGLEIAQRTGLSETAVGGVLTAVSTSLPELVTSVAAVRRGALTLAVGGIIGGNCFDTLFLAFSDVAYREGSLYHAFTDQHLFAIALTIVMTGTLLLGLLRRQKVGFGGIGFESALILALYVGSVAMLVFG